MHTNKPLHVKVRGSTFDGNRLNGLSIVAGAVGGHVMDEGCAAPGASGDGEISSAREALS